MIFSSISYAQVGIQTAYPKGTFHVDGNKDNPKDGTTVVSPAQQANDFIVQSTTGNVGIGTNQPQTKLVVNDGTSNQAILIKDGNQGEGKYLMSDANGLATWKIPNSFKSNRNNNFFYIMTLHRRVYLLTYLLTYLLLRC